MKKYSILDTTYANDQKLSREVFSTNSIAEAFRAYEREKERVPNIPKILTSVALWSRKERMILCRTEIGALE